MGPLSAIEARGLTLHYAGNRRAGGLAARRTAGPPWRRTSRSSEEAGPPTDHGIHGIDLDCAPGEIVGLLGPNGAGKSTLLRVLATALPPTAGTLRLLGEPAVPATSALRRRIGFAQDVAVHLDALSGRDNARFFGRAAGRSASETEASVDVLLGRFGLRPDADRPAAGYSLGMRRKLLLIEALVHAPALLLLDEPTAGLDPPSTHALGLLLRERATAGAAIVLATHDVAEAAALCDRVAFLHRGRNVLEGEPGELIRATGAATRLDFRIDAEAVPTIGVTDADVVHADGERVAVRSRSGTAALPGICAALLNAGAAIRSVHVREPDLRDVFEAATGTELVPVDRTDP